MADLHPDKGAFLSFLDELSRGGQIVKNLLGGRMESAGRHLGQGALNAIDAFLPGDWLPNDIARPEDDLSGRELLGAGDDMVGKALGFGVDMLTDPLTYVPGAAFAKGGARAAELAARGVSAADKLLPGTAEALAKAGRGVRSTFGKQAISDATRASRDEAQATGNIVTQAQAKAFLKATEGMSEEERKIAFRVVNNYKRDAAGKAVPIIADDAPQLATEAERSMASSLVPGEEAGRQVESLTAGDAFKEVKKAGEARPRISDLASDVGIEGVADPLAFDLLSDTAKDSFTGLDVFNRHQPLQDAAKRALDQAYPMAETDPLFASGVQMTNNSVLHPGGGGDRIKRMLADADLGGIKAPNLERIAAKEAAKSAGKITDVADAMITAPPRAAKPLEEAATNATFDTIEGHAARYADRIKALGLPEDQSARLVGFFDKWLPLVQEQYAEAVERGAFHRIPGVDIKRQMPTDYVHRKFTGMTDEAGDVIGGAANSSKERTLKTSEKLIDFLNNPANAGVKLEEDIGKASITRAMQQGKMATGAKMARDLLETTASKARAKEAEAMKVGAKASLTPAESAAIDARYKAFNEEGTSAAVKNIIDEMAKGGAHEDAQVLKDSIFGMAPRGALTGLLAKVNGPFKKSVVFGVAIPKFGAIVRNEVGGLWQTFANPASRGVVGGQIKRLGSNLSGAVADSLHLSIGKDKLSHVLGDWDSALTNAAGNGDRALALMAAKHPEAAELFKHGIADGFVRAEDLAKEMGRTGWKKSFANVMDWPAHIFKGVEDRLRIGLGLDLMAKGHTAKDAARIAKESFYDYSVSSTANRTLRDLVPFATFTANAIPQSAKLLAEKPYVASAVSHAMAANDGDDAVYPYMDSHLNIPLGDNQYVSGLGLPFETLGQVPNPSASLRTFGRQLEQDVVGMSHPLIKGLFSTVSGEDPFFGTETGSYTKLPGNVEGGQAGALYNQMTGFGIPGLTQVDTVARTLGKVFDDRRGAGVKALDMLTGANLVTVDPDRAQQQRLTEALANDPSVMQVRTPINASHDPDTQALIQQLRETKARQKAKRAEAIIKGDVL